MNNEDGFTYDIFISYRWVEPDQTWVRDHLFPALINAKLRVCLDVYDFVPGRDVLAEMERAGTESRRGVCIISPDYIEGNRFTTHERNMLQRRDPAGIESRLIPILYRKTNIPVGIDGLIRVDWTNPSDHIREWKKLLKVLGAKNLNAPSPDDLHNFKSLSSKEIEIFNILLNYYGFGLSRTPNIPPDILSKARKICGVPKEENILCLIELGPPTYDYMLFGSNGIYFTSFFKSIRTPKFISYTEFPALTFSSGRTLFERVTRRVMLGNRQFVNAIDISPDELTNMLNAIKEAVENGRLVGHP